MKKLTFIALALAAVAFVSCTKDDTESPVINISNDVDTATLASGVTSYTITGTVTDNEELKSVKAILTIGTAETTALNVTEFTDKKSYTMNFTVSGITANASVKITAVDAKDNEASKTVVILIGSTAAALTTVTFTDEDGASIIGAGNSSYGSYVDLDGGKNISCIKRFTKS